MRDYCCCCSAKHNIYSNWSESEVNVVLYLLKKIICWINQLTQTHNSSNFDFHSNLDNNKKMMKTVHTTKDEGKKKKKRRIPRTRRMCNRTKIQFALFIGIGTRAYINSLTHLPRMKYISNAFTNKRDSIYPSARRSKRTYTYTHTRDGFRDWLKTSTHKGIICA